MRGIYLGHEEGGEKVELDFEKEKISFILLVGYTGSGKSIFHNNLYKELSKKYSPNELSFVFLDNTMANFVGWQSDHVVKSVVGRPKEAIAALGEIAQRGTEKMLFIHIEECDMVYIDRAAVEAALMKLKKTENVFIVYSTSRIDKEYLNDWMKKFIDLKVVFFVPGGDDSIFLLGNNAASHFKKKGERILAFNDMQIPCRPFSEEEVKMLENFKL